MTFGPLQVLGNSSHQSFNLNVSNTFPKLFLLFNIYGTPVTLKLENRFTCKTEDKSDNSTATNEWWAQNRIGSDKLIM